MTTISGTLFNATSPRPNVTIMLVATRTTASVINTATDISITTDADGAYSFDCNPSAYLVMLIENGSGKQVGYIQVCPDSIDGTLEQYLTNFNPDTLTPDVVREVKEAAASALESMDNAKISETNAANDAGQSAIDAKTASDSAGLAKGYSGTAKSDSESATASATTATKKAAEAKDSADIASDSMNFKTETILIPKWEYPEVKFVQATKTFVFKLQDVSIYKLTPALWDMSNRELVSFTRSTKAWWNGVEYGINVPRTKDDELLIESQATNAWGVSKTSIANSFHGLETLLPDGVNPFGGVDGILKYKTLDGLSRCAVTSLYGLIPEFPFNITASYYVRANTPASIKIRVGSDLIIDVANEWQKITLTETQITRILFYPLNSWGDTPIGSEIYFYGLQLEIGDIATSYIPTDGTAVTRTADIATVRDKS